MRELMSEGLSSSYKSFRVAIDYLVDIMEKDGPFDAIIGYSEGATIAATLLLHEQRRLKKKGIKPMFRYALFFGGWPPIDPETHWVVLSDETETMITIPTCHISRFSSESRFFPLSALWLTGLGWLSVGSLDPYLHGSMALYNVCDPDTAYLFDHAKGHTIPRDKDTVKELGDIIRTAKAEYEIK